MRQQATACIWHTWVALLVSGCDDLRGEPSQRTVDCQYNLTQPDYQPYTAVPGAGWLEGDFDTVVTVRDAGQGAVATLTLALNASVTSDFPPIAVVASGALGSTQSVRILPSLSTKIPFSLNVTIPPGEYRISISPDNESRSRGWCGQFTRFLRVEERTPTVGNVTRIELQPGQPILFIDDFFIASRERTVRRVVPPVQTRVANDSWLSSRVHPWQQITKGLALVNGTAGNSQLTLGIAMNNGSLTEPTADDNADHFACTLDLDDFPSSHWSCSARSMAAQADEPQHQESREAVWPPPSSPIFSLSNTSVRYFRPEDGPVDLTRIGVVYMEAAATFGNVSLRGCSAYPMWLRQDPSQATPETVVLPVDGVQGRPLVHCDSLCEIGTSDCTVVNRSVLELVCRDPDNCLCDGANVSDIGCANDNFGGSWLVPPISTAMNSSLAFVYVQGRRIPSFSPFSAGYDNLARIRRVLVSWVTTDGLRWAPTFWGPPVPPNSTVHQPAEQYGASPFCAVSTGHRTVRGACRSAGGDYNGDPLMAFEMPYDVARQVFWMDLRYSEDGIHFLKVNQDIDEAGGGGDSAIAIPAGLLGKDWNGGLMMGTGAPFIVGNRTFAVMNFVDSGPHFAYVYRNRGNLTAAGVEALGEASFFGNLLPSKWGWFGTHNGWNGVAQLVNKLAISVGVLSYRTGGLVSLRAAASNASVVTKPVRLGSTIESCAVSVGINVNIQGCGDSACTTTVELLDASGQELPKFSGTAAAIIPGTADNVQYPLVFGGGRSLPPTFGQSQYVSIRVSMSRPGIQVFGFSFVCPEF